MKARLESLEKAKSISDNIALSDLIVKSNSEGNIIGSTQSSINTDQGKDAKTTNQDYEEHGDGNIETNTINGDEEDTDDMYKEGSEQDNIEFVTKGGIYTSSPKGPTAATFGNDEEDSIDNDALYVAGVGTPNDNETEIQQSQ